MRLSPADKVRIRTFAVTMAVALSILGGLLFWWEKTTGAVVLWSISGSFLLVGFTLPLLLWPLERLWHYFAFGLGWVNTRVLLAVLFYGAMAPMGLVMRLFGKDILKRRFDPQTPTYWNDTSDEAFDPKNYERQF